MTKKTRQPEADARVIEGESLHLQLTARHPGQGIAHIRQNPKAGFGVVMKTVEVQRFLVQALAAQFTVEHQCRWADAFRGKQVLTGHLNLEHLNLVTADGAIIALELALNAVLLINMVISVKIVVLL